MTMFSMVMSEPPSKYQMSGAMGSVTLTTKGINDEPEYGVTPASRVTVSVVGLVWRKVAPLPSNTTSVKARRNNDSLTR